MTGPLGDVQPQTHGVGRLREGLGHTRDEPAQHGSVSLVALLTPRISVVVISERLPETRLVVIEKLETPYPFGALPKIQVRNKQPGRPTMFGGELLTVELKGDPGLPVAQVSDGKVCRVVGLGEREDVPRVAIDSREEYVERHAGPLRAQLRPFGHATDVNGRVLAGRA